MTPSTQTSGRPEAVPTQRVGHGIVRLRGGDAYEGEYEIDGVWLTLRGRLRNPQASGEVFYSALGTWIWPERRVLVIVDREPETAS